MNKDQRLIEEAYCKIYESVIEPLYFGPPERKQYFLDWLKKQKHEVHSDGSVSVEGDVNLHYLDLVRIPFKFRVVTGSFYCYNNNLTSLEGAPKKVGGAFGCGHNNFTSLKGAPKEVGGAFFCDHNYLTSLEGAPIKVGRKFRTDQFSEEDYRAFAKKRKYVDGKLDKDLNIDLDDFS